MKAYDRRFTDPDPEAGLDEMKDERRRLRGLAHQVARFLNWRLQRTARERHLWNPKTTRLQAEARLRDSHRRGDWLGVMEAAALLWNIEGGQR